MKCWRCGKKLKPNNVQILHLISGLSVPVCSDDRTCYSPAQISKKRRVKP
nr:MAG TPA: co-chaperone HscB [Caudoviricetes sp.]